MQRFARLSHFIGNWAARREWQFMALMAYRLAIICQPDRAVSWMKCGKMLRALGREQEGVNALDKALSLAPHIHSIGVAAMEVRPRSATPDRIGFVILGTTGLCNASCIHCPTGKLATAHVPRTPMPMPLFQKVIDELHALRLPITGQIAFGLFGDGLVDPFVVERARYVRTRFPTTPISINTNAATFNRQRHAILRDHDVVIGLHAESLVPDTFNRLMQPLRLDRVLPRYEEILETFPQRVHVSIPVSAANMNEVADVRRWFEDRGAEVLLAPMMSRCASDRTIFDSLALRPMPMRCPSSILDDLVIDCDGTVLRCCQDFERAEPIANASERSLHDIIFGSERRSHAALLDEGRHLESKTCSRCFGDPMDELASLVQNYGQERSKEPA